MANSGNPQNSLSDSSKSYNSQNWENTKNKQGSYPPQFCKQGSQNSNPNKPQKEPQPNSEYQGNGFNPNSYSYGSNANVQHQQDQQNNPPDNKQFQQNTYYNPQYGHTPPFSRFFPGGLNQVGLQPYDWGNNYSQPYTQQYPPNYEMYPGGNNMSHYQYLQTQQPSQPQQWEPSNYSGMYNQWYAQQQMMNNQDNKSNQQDSNQKKSDQVKEQKHSDKKYDESKFETWNNFSLKIPLCQECTERVQKHVTSSEEVEKMKELILNGAPTESNYSNNSAYGRDRSPSPNNVKKRFPTTIDDRK